MLTTLPAAIRYFLLVFAAGFVFGTIRTLTTADTPDARLVAVAIELPAIMAVSWFACRYTIRYHNVPDRMTERLTMGAIAFSILMVAEFSLDYALNGRSVEDRLALYTQPAYRLGLAGQVVFALLPWVQARMKTE